MKNYNIKKANVIHSDELELYNGYNVIYSL